MPVAHKRITFLIGPDVSPHFFKASDDEMSQTEVRTTLFPLTEPTPICGVGLIRTKVYNFNVPTFGPGVVYDVEQKVRTEQFRFFTEALKKDRLKKYVPQFVMEAEVGTGQECGPDACTMHAWQLSRPEEQSE